MNEKCVCVCVNPYSYPKAAGSIYLKIAMIERVWCLLSH